MYKGPSYRFIEAALPPLQVALSLLVWILIILRIRSLRKANNKFPSRWRDLSIVLIGFSGVLSSAHVLLIVARNIMDSQIWDIVADKNIPEGNLTESDFTAAEVESIIKNFDSEVKLTFAARILLTFALWVSKFSFLCFLMGNRDCLSKGKRTVLDIVSSAIVILFVIVIWATFFSFKPDGSLPTVTSQTFIPRKAWRGCAYIWFSPYLQYTIVSISIAADILQIAIACTIIKTIPGYSHGLALLIGMFTAILAIAVFRLIVIILLKTASFANPHGLILAFVFLADFEVILNILISCIPGARAWVQGFTQRKKKIAALQGGSILNGNGMLGDVEDIEEHPLEFLTENKGGV